MSAFLRELYGAAIPDGGRDELRQLEHWLLDYGQAIVGCLEALESIASPYQEELGTAPVVLQAIAREALRRFDGGD